MRIRAVVAERMKRAEEFAEWLRENGQQVYRVISAAGKEGVADVRKAGEFLEPRVRLLVRESVQNVRQLLDEANQALAELAVPACRKAGVIQKRLEQKFERVGGNVEKSLPAPRTLRSESGKDGAAPAAQVSAIVDKKARRSARRGAERDVGSGGEKPGSASGLNQKRAARRKPGSGHVNLKRSGKDMVSKARLQS